MNKGLIERIFPEGRVWEKPKGLGKCQAYKCSAEAEFPFADDRSRGLCEEHYEKMLGDMN